MKKELLMNTATAVPIGRIIRLVTKAIRLGKGGYTRAELRDLAADLLDLGATILALSDVPRA